MKQDISGHVLDRVIEQAFSIVDAVEKLLPLGPTNVKMSKSEMLKKASAEGTVGVSAFRDLMNNSEIMKVLNNVASNSRPEGEQKAQPRPEEATQTSRLHKSKQGSAKS